ncbi:hypothetical protein Cylst_4744 [Cylindrospermum stagnale PCC 7417]|uniref:Uncharacterized protein n=1 Tax=Cylindrospermum stagnale PCC 7417 TaxID=56107 RepID=K9X2X0_9NOST|nr:hypothetical protein Cylst_4744 [Cylindrospermum stagnale PCC 7417]
MNYFFGRGYFVLDITHPELIAKRGVSHKTSPNIKYASSRTLVETLHGTSLHSLSEISIVLG